MRTLFLHQIYAGLLAFLMAFTSFGFIPESAENGIFTDAAQDAVKTFSEASSNLTNDKHSMPFEGEDDCRAEEDDNTEEDDFIDGTDVFSSSQVRSRLEYLKKPHWRSSTLDQYLGQKVALYLHYHCWKLDINA